MISRHLFLYLIVTSMWIFGEAFKGPHHPSDDRGRHRAHFHAKPKGNKKIIKDTEIIHDQRHIAEDLGQAQYFREEDLSTMEMDFRFFSIHDFDKNTKLDGTELYQAMLHQLERASDLQPGSEEKNYDEEQNLAQLIDSALEECDTNNDGYLDYAEFKASRAKAYKRKDEV